MALPRILAPMLAAALASTVACSGDSTTVSGSNPTSIVVRADTLLAQRGCGKADGQVFKYVVSVLPPSDSTQVPIGDVYDCFADATFVGLAASTANQPFTLAIHAFRATDYAASAGAIQAALATEAQNPAKAIADLDAIATWKTSCSATQQANVTVLAICPNPLR